MKKIIAILLSCILGTTLLVGCGDNKEIVKEPQKQEESKEVKDKIPEIKLKEPFEVKTENGDYTLTINSIKKTDKRNQYEDKVKEVIVIDYVYKNNSFKGANGEKLLIDNSAFVVMDSEGNVLRPYGLGIDKLPQLVPVGGKCTATIAYGVPINSKTIKLQFERNNQPIGEMVVDVK